MWVPRGKTASTVHPCGVEPQHHEENGAISAGFGASGVASRGGDLDADSAKDYGSCENTPRGST